MRQDGNDRRSVRTRQHLIDALVALIQEKSYDSITVQDIIDRANVGRSTFYTHFQDKDDLLARSFERVMAWLARQIDTTQDPLMIPVLGLFDHLQSHRHLYRALLHTRGVDILFRSGEVYLRVVLIEKFTTRRAADSPVPVDVLAAATAGTLLNLARWWLESEMPYTPQQMDAICRVVLLPGIVAGLGSLPGLPA
jgi:AcrR family transcriptional regulator